MLTLMQRAIKLYVKQKHKEGKRVTVGDLSKYFNRDADNIREDLRRIRLELVFEKTMAGLFK